MCAYRSTQCCYYDISDATEYARIPTLTHVEKHCTKRRMMHYRQSAVFRSVRTFIYFLALFWYILQIACALFMFNLMPSRIQKRQRVCVASMSYRTKLLRDTKRGEIIIISYIIYRYSYVQAQYKRPILVDIFSGGCDDDTTQSS